MFRASSAHLQEDTVVHVQRMLMSLSIRVFGGLSVHILSENSSFIDLQHCNTGSHMYYTSTLIYKVDMYSQYYYTTYCKRYGIPKCTRN